RRKDRLGAERAAARHGQRAAGQTGDRQRHAAAGAGRCALGEGEIKISGQGEHRSALIVNSADVTDPATGQFGATVPVDSVETISVFKTPYLAQYGRFTAGVVSVETRRGGDKWDFEINDPLPEFRIWSGQLRGVREASPRLIFNGPLIKDKLYFSEGVEYDLVKRPVRTLPFPFNESKSESV